MYLLARVNVLHCWDCLGGVVYLWGMCEAGLALLQHLHRVESNHAAFQLIGSFGNPAPLVGLLVVCLVLSVSLLLNRWHQRRVWAVCMVVLVGLGMLYVWWLLRRA